MAEEVASVSPAMLFRCPLRPPPSGEPWIVLGNDVVERGETNPGGRIGNERRRRWEKAKAAAGGSNMKELQGGLGEFFGREGAGTVPQNLCCGTIIYGVLLF